MEKVQMQVLERGEHEEVTTVPATRGKIPFYSFDPSGKKILLGRIGYTDYDKDRDLRVVNFFPLQAESGEERQFSLGLSKGTFKFVDHVKMLTPFLDAGFSFHGISQVRGGSRAMALLKYEKITIPDPIHWDHSLYKNTKSNRLVLSLGVWMDSRAMYGLHAVAGFFRQICSNGLVSTVMGMGKMNMGARHFSGDRLNEWARTLTQESHGLPKFQQCSTKALAWPERALRRVAEDPEQLEEYPEIARAPLEQLLELLPSKVFDPLADQLKLMKSEADRFSPLDLLNAITFAEKKSKGSGLAIRRERVMKQLMTLTQLGALKADVKFSRN